MSGERLEGLVTLVAKVCSEDASQTSCTQDPPSSALNVTPKPPVKRNFVLMLDMEQVLSELSSMSSIEALCSLLKISTDEDDEEENEGLSSFAVVGPGNIGPLKKQEPEGCSLTPTHKDSKEIWNASEVLEGSEFDDCLDPREQPEYEILFRQRIGSEDIFLGMSQKDPSTACCKDMVVRIRLPNTKTSDVSLDIRKKFLDLRTPKYKLGLHLPHPVNEENGKAKFKVDTEILEVTLSMVRNFDFLNIS